MRGAPIDLSFISAGVRAVSDYGGRYRSVGTSFKVRSQKPVATTLPSADITKMRVPVLQGYGMVYNKIIAQTDGAMVFIPGSFSASLSKNPRIRALIQHNDADEIGSSDTELFTVDDDHGLGFRLFLRSARAKEAARMVADGVRVGMSAGVNIQQTEVHRISGHDIKFVTKANILEISLVEDGAVTQAFAELADADVEPSLHELSRWNMLRSRNINRDFNQSIQKVLASLRSLREQL